MKKKKRKVNASCLETQFEIENAEQLLSLMELYLSEWEHRDSLFWKQIYTYFYSCLIVMLLPYFHGLGLYMPKGIPDFLFPFAGMIMALAFFIVSNGYIARLKALSEPYQNLITKLPSSYRRKTVRQLYPGIWGLVLNWRMTTFICSIMFLALEGIGATLLYFTGV